MVKGYILTAIFAVTFITTALFLLLLPHSIVDDFFAGPGQCDNVVSIPTLGRIHITREVLGAGAFSLVLVGKAIDLNPVMEVAVKIGMSPEAGVDQDTRILSTLNGTTNFPTYFGTTHVLCKKSDRIYSHAVLIMELLGDSVDTIALSSTEFSTSYRVRTALEIGRGVLDGVQLLHEKLGVMMHDIYGRNIVLRNDQSFSTPKLIDFGESLPILKHGVSEYKYLNRLYTSIREDHREPLGPRDDLERIVYLMVNVVHSGRMPWFAEHGDLIISRKTSMKPSDVCSFLPKEIAQILVYARSGIANAGDLPDYSMVRELIDTALSRLPDATLAGVIN